jgi:hypothetical protein
MDAQWTEEGAWRRMWGDFPALGRLLGEARVRDHELSWFDQAAWGGRCGEMMRGCGGKVILPARMTVCLAFGPVSEICSGPSWICARVRSH